MTESFDGKPQRSDDEIRGSLHKINRGGGESMEMGELSKGMHEYDPLLLSMFNNESAVKACQHELRAAGIYTQLKKKNKKFALFVDYQDREAAGKIIDDFRAGHSDHATTRLKFDYALLGTIIGGSVGTMPLLLTHRVESLILAGGTGLLGMMIGWTIDRARWRKASGRPNPFDLYDVLLLMAIVALGLALPGLWTFILKN